MNNKKFNRQRVSKFILSIFFYFVIYSFLGWVIDSGYNSLVNMSWQPGGYFKSFSLPLPFAPIYGFGALTLVALKRSLQRQHPILLYLLAGIYTTAVEYLGGWWMVTIYYRRVWDYSDEFLNLNGHISLEHTFWWFILSALFIKLIHPQGQKLFKFIFKK